MIYQGIALSDETMWFVTAVEVDLAQKEPVMCAYNVTISFNDIVIAGIQLHKHNDFLLLWYCMDYYFLFSSIYSCFTVLLSDAMEWEGATIKFQKGNVV